MPFTSVQGRKVYYELHGEAGGVPLVLVMGMGGSCRGWLPLQVPDFSQRRRTLIFDHRGAGGSEDPGGDLTTRLMADDTAGLLDALGIERADVLGVFMGGMVAQELALGHPGRVDRLVLVGSSTPFTAAALRGALAREPLFAGTLPRLRVRRLTKSDRVPRSGTGARRG